MTIYSVTLHIILILALSPFVSKCEETKKILPSSTVTIIPIIDSCSNDQSNATGLCHSNKIVTTPNTPTQKLVTLINAQKRDVIQPSTRPVEGKYFGGNVDTSVKEKVPKNLDKSKSEQKMGSTTDKSSMDKRTDNSDTIKTIEDSGDKIKEIEDSTKANAKIVVDNQSSFESRDTLTQSSPVVTGKSAKLEKSNEIIPDNVAQESMDGVTSSNVENEHSTAATTDEAHTESLELTTESGGGSNDKSMTTLIVVKDDDDSSLTHKSTPISRNPITRVAVQDCPCDIIKNVCDINCCCDNDCSAYDRLVFSHCLPLPSLSSSQYCFSEQLIYVKNSPFYISKDPENALLCIETENLKSKTNFTHLKPIDNLKSFVKVYERRKHNEWNKTVLRPLNQYSLNHLPHNKTYKVGQPIWMMNSTTVKVFELPRHSILSDECSSSQQIFYLQEVTSECMTQLKQCSPESVLSSTQYYKNFLLLASSSFENLTSLYNCTKQSCLQIEAYSCKDGHCVSIPEDIIPTWDPEGQLCNNVVESLHFIFKHNGSQGIIKVMLHVNFNNVTLGQDVRLRTKVSFEWYNAFEPTFHRSGNPGYRTRAPLISGTRLAFNFSKEDQQSIPPIHFSTSSSNWITMLSFTREGHCDSSHRRNLLFGINERVKCRLEFDQKKFTDCESIQQHVYKLLLGNLHYLDSNICLASNGDPSIYNLDDWVPLLWTRIPPPYYRDSHPSLPCGHLLTGVNIKILHAYFGEFANPHSKLTGALIESYQSSQLSCVDLKCYVDLTWSVNFVHTFNAPFTKFPEPPVYEIKLPSNFFYPFLSTANRPNEGRSLVILLCFVCCVMGRLVH
uniref:Tectonic-3 n=1 Tax=Cacopsylla melanoneura TaxID=428564 RepID=A0A8D8QWX0_9HEMI